MKAVMMSMLSATLLVTLVPDDALANPQHDRMKRCNVEAKEQSLKGDARKQFMSACLRGKHASAPVAGAMAEGARKTVPNASAKVAEVAPTPPKDRMKVCNQQAGEQALKGAARKTFMADCLKG